MAKSIKVNFIVLYFRLLALDYGTFIQDIFQNSPYEPVNIIGNKLDLHPVKSGYEIPFKQVMDYTHAFMDTKSYLIMYLHAQNLTQETYFLKENVSK